MKILLLSIWHTGTNFCIHHLFGELAINQLSSGSYILQKHVANRRMEIIKKELIEHEKRNKYSLVLVPLRHPSRIKRSFEKRNWTNEQYCEQWDNLINDVAPHNPFYLHLDQEYDREFELAELSKLLPEYNFSGGWPFYHSVTDSHEYPLNRYKMYRKNI